MRYTGYNLYVSIKPVVAIEDSKGAKSMLARLLRKLSTQPRKPVKIEMIIIPVDLTDISVGSEFKLFKKNL